MVAQGKPGRCSLCCCPKGCRTPFSTQWCAPPGMIWKNLSPLACSAVVWVPPQLAWYKGLTRAKWKQAQQGRQGGGITPCPRVRHDPAGKPGLEASGQHLHVAGGWSGQGFTPWHEQGTVVCSVNPETCPRAGTDMSSPWSYGRLGWCRGLPAGCPH